MKGRRQSARCTGRALTALGGTVLVGALAAFAGDSAGAQAPGTTTVTITSAGVQPRNVTIAAGGWVRWINNDTVVHNSTHLPPPGSGQRSLWNSFDIAPHGGDFSVQIGSPGTYNYIDLFYPDDTRFQGTIVVGQAPTATQPLPASATPTRRPTSTSTRRPDDPTPTPTAPGQEGSWIGVLGAAAGSCSPSAMLTPCGGGVPIPIRAAGDLSAYIGRTVRVQGPTFACPGGGDYILAASIEILAGCPATPTPSATPRAGGSPGGGNLALARPARSSGNVQGYSATAAVDGDETSLWYALSERAWLYVDLGESRFFDKVVLKWGAPHASRYGLYAHTGAAWQAIYWTDVGDGSLDVVQLSPTRSRYVLLYMRQSSQTSGFALAELEVYAETARELEANLALDADVYVSSHSPDHPGWHAADGRLDTYWASAPVTASHQIRVGLPQAAAVSELRLYWDARSYSPAYYLFFTASQTRVARVTASGGGLHRIALRTPVDARSITLLVQSVRGGPQVALREFEVYGLAAPPPSAGRAAYTSERAGLAARLSWLDKRQVGITETAKRGSVAGQAAHE
jgi:plastocyanin